MKARSRFAQSLVLLLILIPGCSNRRVKPYESVLKEDLYNMRTAIDQYTQDTKRAPLHLQDLVTGGYLHAIPKDPFTHSSTTWVEVPETAPASRDHRQLGLLDVHCGSQAISTEGTRYDSW